MTEGEIKRWFGDSREVVLASGLMETGSGSALMKALTKKRDSAREFLELSGKVSDNAKEDFRFQLGFISALNEVLRMPDELQKYIKRIEEKQS